MTIDFVIAFGGPVLIGLLGFAFLALTRPRPQGAANVAPDTLAVTLADAEKAARLAADQGARAHDSEPGPSLTGPSLLARRPGLNRSPVARLHPRRPEGDAPVRNSGLVEAPMLVWLALLAAPESIAEAERLHLDA
jgi:hypothetical protein